MGCDLCIYKPEDGPNDCSMSYSTFNDLRYKIVEAYVNVRGGKMPKYNSRDDGLIQAMGLRSPKSVKYMDYYLSALGDEEAEAMQTLLFHSDCDGSYWSDDCMLIADGIDKVLPVMENTGEYDWVVSLRDLFRHAGEIDGMVVVC